MKMDWLEEEFDAYIWTIVNWLKSWKNFGIFWILAMCWWTMIHIVSELLLESWSQIVSLRNNFTVLFRRNCLCSIVG